MKTIKVKLFVERVAACCFVCPCEYDEQDRNTDIEFYLWSQKLTLDRKALLKVAAINMQNKASLLRSRGHFLSWQHDK